MDKGDSELQGIGIGVGAVVFRGDEVLIIRRGKAPFAGQWSIPGGGLHEGERLEDAALREVREETAVEIRLIGLIGVFEALPTARDGEGYLRHTLMIDYAAEWLAGEPAAGDDAAAAAFVPYEEALRRVSSDLTRTAIADALKLRNTVTSGP
ncbi:MAG TPA: phosphohydrolase [Parvularcula sp.]|nr:phosphohydrolase [Parvularcula sp.]HBS32334.1 phosphohydrolase [Parvularcula sp.]HBS36197.1 phosphohydrolase [Parvularcula sp.]